MTRTPLELRKATSRVALAGLGLVLAAVPALAGAATGPASDRPGATANEIEGHYIVVYDDSAGPVNRETAALESEIGFDSERHYRHAVDGFSAELDGAQVRKLRGDPDVAYVTEDRRVSAAAVVPLASGEPTPPTGVRRVLSGTAATSREASDASVAVIDSGIQLDHPDLNAVDGTDCVDPGTPADDGNGHGTHAAGTIAAENDGAGVVGVAPGTTVHAVRVLDDSGSGTWSQVICGIDWVTANAEALEIGVANMSLGGGGSPVKTCATTTDAMHAAICSSTGAGVNYVVAAGNDGWDFDYATQPDLPAAYPEVLTVTALSDSDGLAGGMGGSSCGQVDDRPAGFSNYALTDAGEAHTIAAPGVCIRSTWPGGSYKSISGTSMATPHIAGLVALCLGEAGAAGACAGKSPAEVIAWMRGEAEAYTTEYPDYGFVGDPLNGPGEEYFGFLSVMPGSGPPPAPAPAPEPTPAPGSGSGSGSGSGAAPIDTAPVSPPEAVEPPSDPPESIDGELRPETRITAAKKKLRIKGGQKRVKVKLRFAASVEGSSFRCSLDKGRYRKCSSPFKARVERGKHRFRVKAKAGKGRADRSPAKLVFKVKRKRG